MASHHDPQDLIGRTAFDASGDKIGKVGQVYIDDKTGDPVWVTLSTGLFGGRENFAPLEGSTLSGSELRLTVSKEQVKDAPTVDNEGKLEKEQQDLLYQHYAGHVDQAGATEGSAPSESAAPSTGSDTPYQFTPDGGAGDEDWTGQPVDATAEESDTGDHVRTPVVADDAGDEPSAAELAEPDFAETPGVDKGGAGIDEWAPAAGLTEAAAEADVAGGPRGGGSTPPGALSDHPGAPSVETPTRQTYGAGSAPHNIPVHREDVHIERIPIAEGEEIGEVSQGGPNQPHEIILYAERVTVTKRLVPVERVRIHTTIVSENHDISADLAKDPEPDPRSGHGFTDHSPG